MDIHIRAPACAVGAYAPGMEVEQQLRTAAADVLASRPVEFAYLFGSHARGQARVGSDVDVAVYVSADVDASRHLLLSLEIAGGLAYQAGVGPVNGVVILNEAPLRLVGRVLRDAA